MHWYEEKKGGRGTIEVSHCSRKGTAIEGSMRGRIMVQVPL